MADDGILHDRRQVQSSPLAAVKPDHAQALFVVVEMSHVFSDGFFPGMAKRRVPQVVAQGGRLDHVLVQAQGPADGPGNLGHLHAVGQPRPIMVPRLQVDLGLVFQLPKGATVDDTVPVPLEPGPQVVILLRGQAHGLAALGSPRLQQLIFPLFCPFPNVHRALLSRGSLRFPSGAAGRQGRQKCSLRRSDGGSKLTVSGFPMIPFLVLVIIIEDNAGCFFNRPVRYIDDHAMDPAHNCLGIFQFFVDAVDVRVNRLVG